MQVGLACCDVLALLYTHMVVGDKLDMADCQRSCAADPLMRAFVNHTRVLLDPARARADGGVALAPPGQYVLSVGADAAAWADLLVFSFLGRSVAPGDGQRGPYGLRYDPRGRTVTLEDSACEFHKGVYTFLVLCSVLLLMFFIGVQVVRDQGTKVRPEHQTLVQAPDDDNVSVNSLKNLATPLVLRHAARPAPSFDVRHLRLPPARDQPRLW